jgi:tyrosine-protein phosphatase SIW14
MTRKGQIVVVAAFIVLFVLGCYAYFRSVYEHGKRLRVVAPGRFYRSGQMTAAGFRDAVARYKIRTIINVQNDFPDPDLLLHSFSRATIKESELCRQLGVHYVWLSPDLQPRSTPGGPRPVVLDEYLALLDDPDVYPVLLHCKAGLHRTGVLSAVYRMEYQGWSRQSAYRELKAHGFGDTACTCANDYVGQYVLDYKPRRTRTRLALRWPN